MRQSPETKEGLTALEIELLSALETAAGFVRDMIGESGEAFRQKHLQPVINKTINIREEARRELYIAVK